MMHQKTSRKILFYFFLFMIIGTLNNKNLNNLNFPKIDNIYVTGLNDSQNLKIKNDLNFLKLNNLFFLNKINIIEILNSYSLIEKYSINKIYPSSLEIKIIKTKFLAYVNDTNDNFFLGSNGKLIKTNNTKQKIPTIFGKFKTQDFFEFKKIIDASALNFNDIENLFYFNSGRWDVEMISGILIKLPKEKIKESLDIYNKILSNNNFKKINEIDLRQNNQIIINER